MKQLSITKFIVLLSISLFLFSCEKDKDPDPEPDTPIVDKVYEGSLINPSTVEMQNFLDEGYVIIDGSLEFNEVENLGYLIPFANVKSITGSLKLIGNPEFRSFEGMENLETIGGDFIYDANYIDDKLLSIDALYKLTNIKGDLILKNSTALKDLFSLNELNSIGGSLELINLPNLTTLSGLFELKTIGGNLNIHNLIKLEHAYGLSGLISIGGDLSIIINNPSIESKLTQLGGFYAIEHIAGDLTIKNFSNLNRYYSLINVLTNNGLKGNFTIEGNLYNPTKEQIINGECVNINTIILPDGLYIYGTGTPLYSLEEKGKMDLARNEVTQEIRSTLYEKYLPIKGGDEGFTIISINNHVKTYLEPSSNFVKVNDNDLAPEEPIEGLYRGNIDVNTEPYIDPFLVDEDGLYHIAYDAEIGIVTIAKAEWGVIGEATPESWSTSTNLNESFDLFDYQFTINDLTLTKGDFKFRYSNGWKVVLDPNYDLGNGSVGIKVNSSLGNTISDLIPGGNNITNEVPGYYSLNINWTLDNGISAVLIKTGDLNYIDYSSTEFGLIGTGIIQNGTPVGWDGSILHHIPVVTDQTNYLWTYDHIEVSTDGAFKIREGQNWDGMILGYNDVIMSGESINDFEADGDGNFVSLTNEVYDFDLMIDAITEEYTLFINPASNNVPKLYVPGAYQGWDPANAATITDDDNNGVFIGIVEITGEDFNFKFNSQANWDGPNYGTGETNGTLSIEASAGNLEVPAAGSYEFTVDINNLTWSYIAQ